MRHIALLLIVALLAGCGSGNKKKDRSDAPARDGQRDPDQFEKSGDPPLNANTRFAAGQLAESMGDLNRAVQQYREAIKLDPKHRDAVFRLGSVLTQQRQYPEAIKTWEQYIEMTNHAPAAYNNLA